MSEIDLKVLLNEEYFDSVRCRFARREVEIYVNPTIQEMEMNIAFNSRGYIDSKGNIYLEGYDEPNVRSLTVHDTIINILRYHRVISQDDAQKWTYPNNVQDRGLAVQRQRDTNYFTLSESINPYRHPYIKDDALILFNKAKGKNPDFEFLFEQA